jgi:hypothetical protein
MKTDIRFFMRILATIFVASLTAVMAACSSIPETSPTEPPAQAAMLVFTTQPVGAITGSDFTTQPVVAVEDTRGNVVTSYQGLIVLTITSSTETGGAKLFGATTVETVNGVATFSGLSIDKAGSGYTLTATGRSLAPATSEPFDIAPGAATKLSFARQPVGAKFGEPFSVQPVVVVQDSGGATVTSYTEPIELAVAYGSSTLSGTTVVRAVNGVATFQDLSIDKVGTDYRLTATSGNLVPGMSARFEIKSGPAAKLSFAAQPDSDIAGLPFTTQPVVVVQDVDGNKVTDSTAIVSLTITPGSGADGATLSGTTVVEVVDGAAVFKELFINLAGFGYTLTATSDNLTPAVSDPFALF